METSLAEILSEAAGWLAVQQAQETNVDEKLALERFAAFLAGLSDHDAPPKLEIACSLLSRWIVDQCDWSGPIFAGISAHVQRVHQFARDEAWRRHKLKADS